MYRVEVAAEEKVVVLLSWHGSQRSTLLASVMCGVSETLDTYIVGPSGQKLVGWSGNLCTNNPNIVVHNVGMKTMQVNRPWLCLLQVVLFQGASPVTSCT